MRAQFKSYVFEGYDEEGNMVGVEETLNDCDVLSYVVVNGEVRVLVTCGDGIVDVGLNRVVLLT